MSHNLYIHTLLGIEKLQNEKNILKTYWWPIANNVEIKPENIQDEENWGWTKNMKDETKLTFFVQ